MLVSDLTEITEAADQPRRDGLVERVDLYRVSAVRGLDPGHRAEMGQFLTPPPVARFMASLFSGAEGVTRLLDAGAGVGTLTAAFAEEACYSAVKSSRIEATAYELDPVLVEYLHFTLSGCQELCQQHSIEFAGELKQADFIVEGVEQLRGDLFAPPVEFYNRAILNPPYRKIRGDSQYRVLLRGIGIETSNLYTGFLAIVVRLLEPGGELVAITPRSFCNGPYFKPFRKLLLESMALKRLHVFESRDTTFSDDEVLQENIIFHAVKEGKRDRVVISKAQTVDDDTLSVRDVPYDQVVRPDDPGLVIHIATSEMDSLVKARVSTFEHALDDLGLSVSTGRVVDFRARDLLQAKPGPNAVPLIYPGHLTQGIVRWPDPDVGKPEAITLSPLTRSTMLPSGYYVLVKRFSAKEEARRVVAAVFDPRLVPSPFVAFENHLNYYHVNNAGLPHNLAKGLALFLNSTLVDIYFRQFSGHTQVNATDLRMLRYPSRAALERLGARATDGSPSQREIDGFLEQEMRSMTDLQTPNPVTARELYLTPGGHSRLIRAVVEEFAPRFAPGGQVIYVGETGEKWAYFDADTLHNLGVVVDEHGKMPDVVIYYNANNWLLLIEAVTSHGPVDAKRRGELVRLFQNSRAGLVFVTAFLNRADMAKYISEISWATEVWVADSETHLIHFNGERFLGPYEE